jgi:hypothetical protein
VFAAKNGYLTAWPAADPGKNPQRSPDLSTVAVGFADEFGE